MPANINPDGTINNIAFDKNYVVQPMSKPVGMSFYFSANKNKYSEKEFYKGGEFHEASLVYSPYVPLYVTHGPDWGNPYEGYEILEEF